MQHRLVSCRVGLIYDGTVFVLVQEDIRSPGLVDCALYHRIFYAKVTGVRVRTVVRMRRAAVPASRSKGPILATE